MTTPTGPAYLTPTWRYAGDDWAGTNALIYTVYTIPPVYQTDANGNVQYDASGNPIVVTPGQPMNVGGFTVTGSISYRKRPSVVDGRYDVGSGTPLSGVTGSVVSGVQGQIALSVRQGNTIVPAQDMTDWYADVPAGLTTPTGFRARLLAQPMVTDPSGNLVTVGLQPLYVFGR